VLRAVLGDLAEPALTRSDVEERFLALCRATALPRPEVNAEVVVDEGPAIVVDFLWRSQRLAIETDAYGTHGNRQALSATAAAINASGWPGYDPVPFTRRQILSEPNRLAATVCALLQRAAATAATAPSYFPRK
jgi:very-short-patch-repair endonuclease